MNTLAKLINDGKEKLKNANISDYNTDVFILAEYILGVDKMKYYMEPNKTFDDEIGMKFTEAVEKRCKHIPVQHITGIQQFFQMDFKVNENVLVPRMETEFLVEMCVNYINEQERDVKVLDMCTGSGCIAVSIKKNCERAEVTGADISDKALEIAKENAENNQCKVSFVKTNMFENINDKYDVIISNPPYIPTKDIEELENDVKLHDPRLALDGMEDGLYFYRILAQNATNYMVDGGRMFLEIGYDQGQTVPDILKENGFKDIKVIKDLADLDRMVIATI